MMDDLTGYGPDAELEADVCVVGTGAEGIALVREFLGTRARVIVLESGGLEPDHETDLLKEGEAEGLAGSASSRGAAAASAALPAAKESNTDPLYFHRPPARSGYWA